MIKYQPKILFLDIETKPALAYVWNCWKVNISPEQIVQPTGMLCFAAKYLGEEETHFYSEWTHTRFEMLFALQKLINESVAVVTYNGDDFDLPKIHGEFLLEGLDPPAPITSIDLLKVVRKLGFMMNRLAFVGPHLGIGEKMKHEGFGLWVAVMAGDVAARDRMRSYNIQDVVMMEPLYHKLKPFIKNHPHLTHTKVECGACGSNNVQSRGWRRTKHYRIKRTQCQDCGSWAESTREKIS
jgi:hypothetical protein